MRKPDVVVVGAGVFGAWISWWLQRSGRQVLLIDQYGPANTRASSGGESRVIRMAYGPDAVYTGMAQRSLELWTGLLAQVGRPELFQRTGVLWMALQQDSQARQSLAVLAAAGIRHEQLQASQLRERYPQIVVPDAGWAIFEPDSGALLARRAVQAVVNEACRLGTELLLDQVLPMTDTQCRIHTLAGRSYAPDTLVLACGPWLGRIQPEILAGRIFVTRQEVHYFGLSAGETRFAPAVLPTWMDFERDWYGMPDLEGRGFKLACDVHGPAHDPDHNERIPTTAGIAAARALLSRRFPALAGAPLLASEVCQYENTSNGDFLLDQHPKNPQVWFAGGGSGHGFKHGPAVGEYLLGRLEQRTVPEPRFSLASKQTQQRRQVH